MSIWESLSARPACTPVQPLWLLICKTISPSVRLLYQQQSYSWCPALSSTAMQILHLYMKIGITSLNIFLVAKGVVRHIPCTCNHNKPCLWPDLNEREGRGGERGQIFANSQLNDDDVVRIVFEWPESQWADIDSELSGKCELCKLYLTRTLGPEASLPVCLIKQTDAWLCFSAQKKRKNSCSLHPRSTARGLTGWTACRSLSNHIKRSFSCINFKALNCANINGKDSN